MLQPTTIDDAGKRVPLVRFNVTLLPWPCGPLPVHVQRAMRSAVMSENWNPRVYLSRESLLRVIPFGLFPAIAVLVTIGLRPYFNAPAYSPWYFIALLAMFLPLIRWVGMSMLVTSVRRLAASIAVSHGFCGSCGYLLPDDPKTDTGRVRCPECGAEWDHMQQGDRS